MRILQIANYVEGVGGISVQVALLQEKLRGEGYTCDILSTKGALMKRVKALLELLSNGWKYDVFHIHACSDRGFMPAVLGISIGRLLKKRIVLTFHGGGADDFFKRREGLIKHYLNRTSANIVLSGFIGQVFDKYGISYTVIPNILDIDDAIYRVRNEIAPRFISIRSFTETYNIKCTINAFQIVQKKYSDARLTLLGNGPLKVELEKYVTDCHLPNVVFVGQIPNTEIYRYMDDADIMVSSSRFDNMPVSVLEGFKAGLLVIASNVGGLPYMIKDGQNGLLFESDNDRQLAEKMISAVEHPEATLRMIENAYHCLDTYKWDHCRDVLLALYKG